jgi:hypothetical protein
MLWLGVRSSWNPRSWLVGVVVDVALRDGQLDGKLRELRSHLDGRAVRVTYWIAPGRRIVLLTVLAKTRMREVGEVERARRALARCLAEEHRVEDGDD